SLLLGVATGLVWAPCAGPVLGLILTGAALQGASVATSFLLLAYAAGAATSLALALLAGGRVFAAMKRSLGVGVWLRRGLGALVLVAVAAIAAGLDTGLLTRLSAAGTASLEQSLIDTLHPETQSPQTAMMAGTPAMTGAKGAAAGALPVEGKMPALDGAVGWLNSMPLTPEALRGKVVLVDFWTYSCINCLRAIPYVRAWAEKYKDQGLVVIGVHTPEFAFEKNLDNVRKAVADLGIAYPVAIDNSYAVWRAFDNRYWPAHYFIDAQGRIRHHHFGEGSYDISERVIQQLLSEAHGAAMAGSLVSVDASGAQAASTFADVLSPETYLGYERAENFVSPGGLVRDVAHVYAAPGMPKLNEWGLAGDWTVHDEHAALDGGEGAIVFRFHARDLHLVLGPAADGAPVRFRVTIDGRAPGADHGVDTDADGQGTVTAERLYQLVRQKGEVAEHTFEIRFLAPGVRAYAFTFG
ncbi:MAG: redoxin family protein, partial [Xanthobacteraceae bacterium]